VSSPTGSGAFTPRFGAFGEPQGNATQRLMADGIKGFAGGYALTGAVYLFGMRMLDSRTGRFLASDPLLFPAQSPQALNRYSYAANNPFRFSDPSGGQYNDVALSFSASPTNNSTPLLFSFEIGNRDVLSKMTGGITIDFQLSEALRHGFAIDMGGVGDLGALGATIGAFNGLPALPIGLPSTYGAPQMAINSVLALLYTDNPGGNQNRFLGAFRDLMQSGGIYDFKSYGVDATISGLQIENLGNFNYGVVSAAIGLPLEIALIGAGGYSYMQHNKEVDYARLHRSVFYGDLTTFPFGDDPIDSFFIMQGYQYFQTNAASMRNLVLQSYGLGLK
jgi:RHS repeat-associated protein